MTRRIRALACATALATVAFAAPVFVAAGSTVVVDDDGAQCKKADHTTIQAAVTAAPAGAKIQVCPGTYVEQVTIPAGKNGLSLESKNPLAAVIKAPPGMVVPFAIVRVNGAQGVSIKGFTITGPGPTPSSCAADFYGVRLDGGSTATIEKNHITLIRDTVLSGCQRGNAIQVGRQAEAQTATAKIKSNEIDNYQKSGIVVDGTGSHADIDHNTITGVGSTNVIAQNGIQISRGATADAKHNTITDNLYAPQTFASAGILVFDAGAGVTLDHNKVLRTDEGFYLINADGILVKHNESHNNSFDGFGLDETDNATLSHNEANNNASDGIWVGNYEFDDELFESTGNLLEHNKMAGNDHHDAHDDNAPGANTWDHNNCDTENQDGLCD